MKPEEVSQTIVDALPGAQVMLEGEDCRFTVNVVSDDFNGLLPLKRQQKVLNLFSDALRTGTLHALTVGAFTQDEWQQKQANSALVQFS